MSGTSSRAVTRLCMAIAMLLLMTGCDVGGLAGDDEPPAADAEGSETEADEAPTPDSESPDTPDADDPDAHAGDMANMVRVTEDMLLDGSAGSGDLRIRASDDPIPSEDGPFPGQGTFRVFCQLSHMSFDDPIVFPGDAGASHGHQFVGNTETNADSTAASIAGGGNSTCTGGIADRSAYWTPVIVDTGSDAIVRPQIFAAYYQSGFSGVDAESIEPIPEGLMMIAGDPTRAPDDSQGDSGPFRGFSNARWACFGGGGAPQTQGDGTTIPDCGEQQVSMIINFPQCWDGENLDTDDQSHMAYPTGSQCPQSHPVGIPALMQFWIFPSDGDTSDWRLASDTYPSDQHGGASVHADFVNGWDPDIMDRWLNACIRPELDCERAELGDGESLF